MIVHDSPWESKTVYDYQIAIVSHFRLVFIRILIDVMKFNKNDVSLYEEIRNSFACKFCKWKCNYILYKTKYKMMKVMRNLLKSSGITNFLDIISGIPISESIDNLST